MRRAQGLRGKGLDEGGGGVSAVREGVQGMAAHLAMPSLTSFLKSYIRTCQKVPASMESVWRLLTEAKETNLIQSHKKSQ